jgi:hypothetical protein
MTDITSYVNGPISTLADFQLKIPARRPAVAVTTSGLDVELRVAPTGRDAIFRALVDGSPVGTVTVPAGSFRPASPTPLSITISANQIITWEVIQIGLGPGDEVGATVTFFVRISS